MLIRVFSKLVVERRLTTLAFARTTPDKIQLDLSFRLAAFAFLSYIRHVVGTSLQITKYTSRIKPPSERSESKQGRSTFQEAANAPREGEFSSGSLWNLISL